MKKAKRTKKTIENRNNWTEAPFWLMPWTDGKLSARFAGSEIRFDASRAEAMLESLNRTPRTITQGGVRLLLTEDESEQFIALLVQYLHSCEEEPTSCTARTRRQAIARAEDRKTPQAQAAPKLTLVG